MGIAEQVARNRHEIDRRAPALVERIGAERAAKSTVTVKNAAELPLAERARYGFGPDWSTREPTRNRRRPR